MSRKGRLSPFVDQVPLPTNGPIGEDELLVHDFSPMTLPFREDIRGFQNFGGAEEGGDGERDAGAREVREVVPRRPRRATKSNPPSKAARLPHFAQAWHQVTDNNFILNIVYNGYKIQFTSTPIQNNYS